MDKDVLLERLRAGDDIETLAEEFAHQLNEAQRAYKAEQERELRKLTVGYKACEKVAAALNELFTAYGWQSDSFTADEVYEAAEMWNGLFNIDKPEKKGSKKLSDFARDFLR